MLAVLLSRDYPVYRGTQLRFLLQSESGRIAGPDPPAPIAHSPG